jgi:hypothetical protein
MPAAKEELEEQLLPAAAIAITPLLQLAHLLPNF